MAVSVTNIGGAATTGTTTSLSSITVPAGALIVVTADESNSLTIGTFADSASNTYRTAVDKNDAGHHAVGIHYAYNATAISSGTISYTRSGSVSDFSVVYATGVVRASDPHLTAADASSTATSTSAPTVTSGSPGVSGALFVGATSTTGTSNVWTQPSGWTGFTGVGGLCAGWIVNSGSGTETYNPTDTKTGNVVSAVTAFRALAPVTATATAGSVHIRGKTGTVLLNKRSFASSGSVHIRGKTGTVLTPRLVQASAGSVHIRGKTGTVLTPRSAIATAGSVHILGQVAGVEAGAAAFAHGGSVHIRGQVGVVLAPRLVQATSGSVHIVGKSGIANSGQVATAQSGNIYVRGSVASSGISKIVLGQSGRVRTIGASGRIFISQRPPRDRIAYVDVENRTARVKKELRAAKVA